MSDFGRVLVGTVLLIACLAGVTVGQEPDAFSDDKAAIRKAATAYMAAVREGDADKIAACWTEDGDFTDASGVSQNGRRLAQRAVRISREQDSDLATQVESIRFVTRDVAIEDGSLEHPDSSFVRYTAVWVRQDGKWLLDAVRAAAGEAQSPYDHLRPLAWMVGEWQTEADSTVKASATCQWSRERNFLLREIRLSSETGDTMTVTQRIGWDPLAAKIRVWTFDSSGGHSEGTFVREASGWVVSTLGVTPDGKRTESTNVYTRGDANSCSVESHSLIDGEELPDRKLRLIRKQK
jgi:uncharacterized protein (TIGR02246 family)